MVRVTVLLCLFALLSGCESLRYYGQAAAGQLALMSGQHDIAMVLDDPSTPVELKAKLQLVMELREFAHSELALPVAGQFSHYADLERTSVVWNVFAAPELSFELKTWCYPIVGCAAYRGYFAQERAQAYAEELEGQGYDTYVGGVAAYSTLGWLDDPILNTFVYREELQLADLLFHELAHKLLYIPGDTLFNESFATVVAAEGVKRWVQRRDNIGQYDDYRNGRQQQKDFVELVATARAALADVYNLALGDGEKREKKRQLMDKLRLDYQSLQQTWGSGQAYSAWMAEPLNNAKLNSVALYNGLVPGLEELLAKDGNNLSRFYRRCMEFRVLEPDERLQRLGPERLGSGL